MAAQFDVVCERCGKTFQVEARRTSTAKYCSRTCHYNTVALTCAICGKVRAVKRSWLDRVFTCGAPECTSAYRWREFKTRIEPVIGEPIEDAIARRYVTERKSYRAISAELGINLRTVMHGLAHAGIMPRRGSEAVATQWEANPERRSAQADWLTQVKQRRKAVWKGGHRYAHETRDWIAEAEAIRTRDGHCCTRCGMTDAEHLALHGRMLNVHHIIHFAISHDDAPGNLTTVCSTCHKRLEQSFLGLL